MDHIPTPLDSLPGIGIPITKIVPYDFQGFTTFPSRYGFGSEKPLGEEQSADDTASLMQSWLYFGLLAEFFGEPVNVEEFTCGSREPCAQSLLCLAPLNRLMKSHSPEKDRQPLLLQKACEKLRIFLKSPHYFTSPVLEIEFSIRVLIHTLGDYVDCPATSQNMHTLIENRFLESGWCPSQVAEIGRYENEVVAYYLCRLRRPNRYNVSHSGCSKIQCVANNVSEQYQNRHTHRTNPCLDDDLFGSNSTAVNRSSGSDELEPCPFVHVDAQEVRKIIEGGIPLVLTDTSSSDGLELRVSDLIGLEWTVCESDKRTAFHLAASMGSLVADTTTASVKFDTLLKAFPSKAQIDSKTTKAMGSDVAGGQTPLYYAAKFRIHFAARKLLDMGTNVFVRDEEGIRL